MDFSSILGLIGTAASGGLFGGITGLIGAGTQMYFEYKTAQLRIEEAKIKNAHELAVMSAEWAGRERVAQVEATGAEAVADANALAASFKMEPEMYSAGQKLSPTQRWVFVVLDAIRGLIRPGLTLYLAAVTTYILWLVQQRLSVAVLTASEALDVWRMVVSTVMYLTTTCVLWWFGTRNKAKQPGS